MKTLLEMTLYIIVVKASKVPNNIHRPQSSCFLDCPATATSAERFVSKLHRRHHSQQFCDRLSQLAHAFQHNRLLLLLLNCTSARTHTARYIVLIQIQADIE